MRTTMRRQKRHFCFSVDKIHDEMLETVTDRK